MRTLLGIFLFSCLTFPFVGTYIWLQYEQAEVKSEVSEKLEDGFEPKELVTLSFTKEELLQLRWEHEREFEFQGQMYDVIEKKEQGDSVVFICWWDHEETQLKDQLNKLMAGPRNDFPQNKNQKNRLDTFGKTLYVVSSLYFWKKNLDGYPKTAFYPSPLFYTSFAQRPPTPPPDRA